MSSQLARDGNRKRNDWGRKGAVLIIPQTPANSVRSETLTKPPRRSASSGAAPKPRRFKTIAVDPPWDVQQTGTLGAQRHYKLMTLERIRMLPVAELAEDDAHVWLWVTNATLREGYDLLEHWGFTPRSPLTWVKPRMGLGNYLRNTTEHLLLGTRGRAPVNFRAQPTWLFAPVQDHSHKPEEYYAVIERVSSGPYLELFARRARAGWSVWGNEVDADITVPGFPVPSDEDHLGAAA